MTTERASQLRLRDGVQMAYWIRRNEGSTRCLVFLHGGASNHTRWSELLESRALSENYSVLRPDLRGSGSSRVDGQVGIESWCGDLIELLDAERFETAILVGHSLGAQLALHFAARHPARTAALALVDPVCRSALRGRQRLFAHLRPLLALAAGGVRCAHRLGLPRRALEPLDLRELDEDVRRVLPTPGGRAKLERRYSSLREILRHEPLATYLDQAVATYAPLPPFAAIKAPVLLLCATGANGLGDHVRRAAEQLGAAVIVPFDSSHWPTTEKPADVRRALERWLARLFSDRD